MNLAFILSIGSLFVLADLFPARIEGKVSAVDVIATEFPLLLGLFLVVGLPIAWIRLVSRAASAAGKRMPPHKFAFNVAFSTFQVAVFEFVAHAFGARGVPNWHAWGAVAIALVASAVGQHVVWEALFRALGHRRPIRESLRNSTLNAAADLVMASLGLVAVSLYLRSPEEVLPLFVLVGAFLAGNRAYGKLRNRYGRVSQLYDFSQVVAASSQDADGIATVTAKARQMLHAAGAELVLLSGPYPEPAAALLVQSWADDERRRTIDFAELPVRVRGALEGAPSCDEHEMVVALRSEHGPIGAISVSHPAVDGDTFDDDDRMLFETLASHAAAWLENGRLIDRLRDEIAEREHQAFHDALTNLPNRRLFQSRAEAAIANAVAGSLEGAVLLLDLDLFKEVNDALGHPVGDLLLQDVGVRIESILPQTGLVARLGGDEFAILLTAMPNPDDAGAFAQHVVNELRRPFVIQDMHISVDASVGIAVFPRDGAEASLILQRADVAMYSAKTSKTSVEYYASNRDFSSTRRLSMLSELKVAIEQRQLFLNYQPKIDLSNGALVGVESLIRWRHPVHGLIMPDEFIPLAEQSGLIGELSMYVLRLSLEQQQAWASEGLDISVAVNLSVRNLLDLELSRSVERMLREHDVPSNRLTLEITESGIMSDPTRSIRVLEELASLGVKLSVDDFGTGQSSLAYLRQLPVHEVKIDRCFVKAMATNASDEAIARSIIDLGRNLGLGVVAEGIEEEASYRRLRELGCATGQGYYMSRPMPAEDYPAWLAGDAPYRSIHREAPRSIRQPVGVGRIRSA